MNKYNFKIYDDFEEFMKVYETYEDPDGQLQVPQPFSRQQLKILFDKCGNLIHMPGEHHDNHCSYRNDKCEKCNSTVKDNCKYVYDVYLREKKLKRILK